MMNRSIMMEDEGLFSIVLYIMIWLVMISYSLAHLGTLSGEATSFRRS